ncbi:dienelactone hydrolase family protein [Oceanibacterium hippocampi]|uniref:Alpha/beta hydrolase family protein n=1 Tax=Oceanibacterium hippocampi TaxID=745714 RepID=A0A1Y5TGH7_9PROT|nr:dienelactone hydrolase family protein [Oceanibacterium hippocampi]SLN63332.1 Alpha/beta hydrolase family protein [Oceanibacterium hippocampi]
MIAMRMCRRIIVPVLLAVAILAGCAGSQASDSGSDADELLRTWEGAQIYLPGPRPRSGVRIRDVDLAAYEPSDGAVPVIVHAHGCTGLSRASAEFGYRMAKAGFLVIEPDSFARSYKPRSCDGPRAKGGFHRGVLGWRHAEIDHALKKVRELPFVDRDNVFLAGHSEGAIATATYEGEVVSGRIIEGWTCHAGWPEYRGLAAPADEPVLALLGEDDPWFRGRAVLTGDCGAFMRGAGQRSIVYRAPSPLADQHWLSFDEGVRAEILDFLNRYRTR